MKWWSPSKYSNTDDELNFFIYNFVVYCPSSNRNKSKADKTKNVKSKRHTTYQHVSSQKCSFYERGITGPLLRKILYQIRNPLIKTGAYASIKFDKSDVDAIERKICEIQNNIGAKDSEFDLMVFKKRTDMSDTEAIYYYIRNAFAHGSFEKKKTPKEAIYYFESSRKGMVQARMRLKSSTLKRLIELMNKTPGELKKPKAK